ncbi:MAG: hypothetical protein B7Y88_11485 [Sphingomonadales bacterium 32-64-17]|nr:MAG: hypothetical protein B7Y88_11485 [Sphingomonadales bacterium 32-64-17]
MAPASGPMGSGGAGSTAAASYWALAVLFIVNVFNQGDRMLFGVVVEPIRRDLLLSDTSISLISGLFFVLFNLLAGLFLARAIDRGNRVRILALGVLAWSLATAAQGLAQGFWSLAAARIAVGIGEATAFPAVMSLIPDLFRAEARGRAVAVFQSSSFVGIVGGTVVAGVLGAALGWRSMFFVCGLAGLGAAALLVLTVPEPKRSDGEEAELVPEAYLSGMVKAALRVLKLPGLPALLVGLGFAAMMTFVLASWGPAFLLRSHGVPLAEVGLVIGPSVGIGGILGTIISGIAADVLVRRRGHASAMLLVPMVTVPLALPFMAAFILAPSLLWAMLSAACMNALLSAALPPSMNFAVNGAATRDRAMVSTMLLAAMGLIGGSLGPFLVGMLSDRLAAEHGAESLRMAMTAMLVVPVLASVCLTFAWRHARGGASHPAA